ncbi:DUF4249 domain-containing protein [Salinimicrobium oceani]|uniref:DUF4249 domain-containing protein n=1 Tax=Salinimicrobium oceani TaxID=2722702 RepID=A0ABX1CY69_9FLAO|nr:DUF4249 domain-containing protein [Salinimicrobium oceani]NJW51586.1 DUF4249 domain-containing protein [Salinimicrobium oceani]
MSIKLRSYFFLKNNTLWMLLFFAGTLQSCVEPFDFEQETFESALVVEGRITDNVQHHRIVLSRSFRFEEEKAAPEVNAQVIVQEEGQREYLFQEVEPGIYESREEFSAKPGMEYQLLINTSSNEVYASEPTVLTPQSSIENVTASKIINEEGVSGIVMQVDSGSIPGESPFLMYEYQEDFKMVSPMSALNDFDIVNDQITLVLKEKEEYTCFGSDKSTDINLVNTTLLGGNKVKGHVLNFIPKNDPRIAQRYSLLVKQYVLSQSAYSYYNTLKDLSQAESLFSQIQPGLLQGNMYSVTQPDEPVIGFFSVASVATKRIFFDFLDFYSLSEGGATFVTNCPITRPDATTLKALIRAGEVKFLEEANMQPPDEEGAGDYRVVPLYCMDCTVYGTNVVPDFWEE